jgi:hypothetical protein
LPLALAQVVCTTENRFKLSSYGGSNSVEPDLHYHCNFIHLFYLGNWSGPFDWFWEVQKAALVWLICILLTRAVFVTVADLDAFKRRILVRLWR